MDFMRLGFRFIAPFGRKLIEDPSLATQMEHVPEECGSLRDT